MDVELKIQRFDPEKDTAPHWETYRVPVEPMDRVLDVLTRAKELLDGSITFRRSCAHGVCGSDALLINGRNRLACKVRVEQLARACPDHLGPWVHGRHGDGGRHQRHGIR